jgi:hypothetical protein
MRENASRNPTSAAALFDDLATAQPSSQRQ